MTKTKTLDGFFDYFKTHLGTGDCPDHLWDELLIFADLCIDVGEWEYESAARWMAENKKWPNTCQGSYFPRRVWYFWGGITGLGLGTGQISNHLERTYCPGMYPFEELMKRLGRGLLEEGMVEP